VSASKTSSQSASGAQLANVALQHWPPAAVAAAQLLDIIKTSRPQDSAWKCCTQSMTQQSHNLFIA
jgi:hypothetical protein